MNKREISEKQKRLKKPMKYDPDKNLRKLKPKDFLDTMIYCLEWGDYEAFTDVLYAYVSLHNKSAVAKQMGVSRRALYHMVSKEGNPTIKNLMSLYQAIKKAA